MASCLDSISGDQDKEKDKSTTPTTITNVECLICFDTVTPSKIRDGLGEKTWIKIMDHGCSFILEEPLPSEILKMVCENQSINSVLFCNGCERTMTELYLTHITLLDAREGMLNGVAMIAEGIKVANQVLAMVKEDHCSHHDASGSKVDETSSKIIAQGNKCFSI